MSATLRDGLSIATIPTGQSFVVDGPRDGRFELPKSELEPALRAAVETKATSDETCERWFEARHLIASERVARVEAWGASRLPEKKKGVKKVTFLPGSRFTCHGCGACCESYVYEPVYERERQAILARAAELAPHVPTPQDAWFTKGDEKGLDGNPSYAFGRTASGACVFLGKDRLCEVHRWLGADTKPRICRAFPLTMTERPDATVVSLRPECETFARSRDDGQPLEEQLAWVSRIVADTQHPNSIPALVRMLDDVFVPYPLARSIEARVLRYVKTAPTVDLAHLATRDLVMATLKSLKPSPDVAELNHAEAVVANAPMALLAELCGTIEPERALAELGGILTIMLGALPKFFELRAKSQTGTIPREHDRFTADTLGGLHAALASRLGWPRHDDVSQTLRDEATRAMKVAHGLGDPAVLDFVRECAFQLYGGSRPMGQLAGLVYGYAHTALVFVVARFGARLLALRRGATAAGREDWNHAIAVIDRELGLMDLSGVSPRVVAFYADLFESDDIPS